MRTLINTLNPLLSFALLAAILTGCSSVQHAKDSQRVAPGVASQDFLFWSPALQREMPYRVFLPTIINPGTRLPVVYLLHGGGGNYRDWSNNSDVSKYALTGMILVMPEGNSSYYLNAVEPPNDKYEDYVTRDLPADVDTRFPTAPGRANRAIVGISMGGFGAIKLALSHPEAFAFAGAISPAIDVAERRFSWKRIPQWWGFREIFGPPGSVDRRSRDPFFLVQTADPRATPYFYLTAGSQEALLEPISRFAASLKQTPFRYEFHVNPGAHDWGEWNSQLPGCFDQLQKTVLSP